MQKKKKGIAFILASIVVWTLIAIVNFIGLKTWYTWCCIAVLMPLAIFFTSLLGIKLNNNENPLNKIGFIFTLNEILYILIACYMQSIYPEKLVMILAMIFGAHLLPFGWLYKSKMYTISSIIITISTLVLGIVFNSGIVACFMIIYEIIFSIVLHFENKQIKNL